MSEPTDQRGAPVPGTRNRTLEPPDPPITGSTTDYVENKTIPFEKLASMGDVARAPVTVRVDGDKILHGTQRAEALALLGISEEVLDEAWSYFAADNNPPGEYENWGWAMQHQEGMGWRVDVEVVQHRYEGIDGLASIDPRTAQRWVTFRARQWYHTGADHMVPPDASTEITKRERLEDAGAASASWFQVEQSEIDSTVDASEALLAARMELGNARNEIQVALKVANAAWQGPRSEATKFKFGLEYEVISAAWDSADAWRQYLDDLVKQQRDAKEQSDNLRNELFVEAGLFLVPFMGGLALKFALSAGRAAKTALAGGKVLTYAQKIGRIVAPLRSRYGAVVGRIYQSNKTLTATRILARGAGGLASTAAVNKAGGRETTAGDWLMAFALAGAGYKLSERAGKLLGTIEETHGVKFSPRVIAAATSGGDGLGQSGVKAVTDQALAAPFAIGLVSDAIRRPAEARAKKFARELLENDPNSVPAQRARARLDRERPPADPDGRFHSDPVDSQTLQKYIDQEIEKTVNRQVDPLLDFTYGVGTQAAESAHQTITRPPSPAPDAPSGTVPQPVRN